MASITLLDGGMGQELIRRSGQAPTPLWSTGIMRAQPHLVTEIHRDFFEAGATIATVNSYAIHRDRLRPVEMEDEFDSLHETALVAAEAARDAAIADMKLLPGGLRIAGAIGPLGNSYRPEVHPPAGQATALYKEVADRLAARVDLLLIETASSLLNARTALDGALSAALAAAAAKEPREIGAPPAVPPVWLGISVDDEDGTRFRSGEPVADLIPMLRDGAAAVLVNCSAPEAIPASLDILARADLPIGAYANAFEGITKAFLQDGSTVSALSARRDMGPAPYADHAMKWVEEHGATIVGGCCETGPDHIGEIAQRLRAAGHTIA